MLAMLSRNWWAFALQGVVAIIWGILAILWPGLTLRVLVTLFGAYALVDGVISVIAGIAAHDRNRRWWEVVVRGVAGIIIGVVTFFWPGLTALTLLYFIAAWEIVTGILLIMGAIQLRRIIENEWVMILSGAASILFGVILFIFPGAGALSLVWLIGAYSIAFGILLLALALRLRGVPRQPGTSDPSRVSSV
jgi:uncharacterized membrane protein HdeD (DUF308 family)